MNKLLEILLTYIFQDTLMSSVTNQDLDLDTNNQDQNKIKSELMVLYNRLDELLLSITNLRNLL